MIYKLQEVDETNIILPDKNLHILVENLPNFLVNEAKDDELIEVSTYNQRFSSICKK